jgi:hypothetical protein
METVSWTERLVAAGYRSQEAIPFPGTRVQALVSLSRQEFDREQQMRRDLAAEYERRLEAVRQEEVDRQIADENSRRQASMSLANVSPSR